MKNQLFLSWPIFLLLIVTGIPSSMANPIFEGNEIYELRTYHLKFGSNEALLMNYLDEVLEPELRSVGVNHFRKYREYGMGEPRKLWVLISYPNAEIYTDAQFMTSTKAFMVKSEEYDSVRPDRPLYSRFESMLLLAIDGMPLLEDPIQNAGLFELRLYEGYSEDATRRKIEMFNVEELELFEKTGLHSVFFGDMISGPIRPCLVYMLAFKDMQERDKNWKIFLDHPEWKSMLSNPRYANTVSNIRKIFLTPM